MIKTPNFSWCGRAISAVTLFPLKRARRTAGRYAARWS